MKNWNGKEVYHQNELHFCPTCRTQMTLRQLHHNPPIVNGSGWIEGAGLVCILCQLRKETDIVLANLAGESKKEFAGWSPATRALIDSVKEENTVGWFHHNQPADPASPGPTDSGYIGSGQIGAVPFTSGGTGLGFYTPPPPNDPAMVKDVCSTTCIYCGKQAVIKSTCTACNRGQYQDPFTKNWR